MLVDCAAPVDWPANIRVPATHLRGSLASQRVSDGLQHIHVLAVTKNVKSFMQLFGCQRPLAEYHPIKRLSFCLLNSSRLTRGASVIVGSLDEEV